MAFHPQFTRKSVICLTGHLQARQLHALQSLYFKVANHGRVTTAMDENVPQVR